LELFEAFITNSSALPTFQEMLIPTQNYYLDSEHVISCSLCCHTGGALLPQFAYSICT